MRSEQEITEFMERSFNLTGRFAELLQALQDNGCHPEICKGAYAVRDTMTKIGAFAPVLSWVLELAPSPEELNEVMRIKKRLPSDMDCDLLGSAILDRLEGMLSVGYEHIKKGTHIRVG